MSSNLLSRLIGGSKYGGDRQFWRSNDNIYATHEPVGFKFFNKANVTSLLHTLKMRHVFVDLGDLHNEMTQVFHMHTSTFAAGYVNPRDTALIAKRVQRANLAVLARFNRLYGTHATFQGQYENVLANPNNIGPYPKRADFKDRSIENEHGRSRPMIINNNNSFGPIRAGGEYVRERPRLTKQQLQAFASSISL